MLSDRMKGDVQQAHMDGSAAVTFKKYPDKPGTVTVNVSSLMGELIDGWRKEVEELEYELGEARLDASFYQAMSED
jgi:hypothetical protein